MPTHYKAAGHNDPLRTNRTVYDGESIGESISSDVDSPNRCQQHPKARAPARIYYEEHQAYTTHHAWRSITAFIKAEPDGTIKASVRQAKQVYLASVQ